MVWVGFAEIIFQSDNKRKITGQNIGDSRVKGVSFLKK
jgi:hypothetical protein